MNQQFSISAIFHLGNYNYEELEVEIEYNPSDPLECGVISAAIVKKIAEGHGDDAYAWFYAAPDVIDLINNNNLGLITDLAKQDCAERAAEIADLRRFERDIRADIIRGCRKGI